MNNFSKNLKFLRKQKGISQEALAQELDLKRNNIAAYESKNVEPRMNTLVKFANYFKLPLDELVKGDLSNDKDAYLNGLDHIRAWNMKFDADIQDIDGLHENLGAVSDYVLQNRCYHGKEFSSAIDKINTFLKQNI